MDRAYVDIHTHRRRGAGIEVVATPAGPGELPGRVFPAKPFVTGVHPWDAAKLDEQGLTRVLHETERAAAWAIGEIGLDYAVAAGPNGEDARERQKAVFEAQLRIAEARGLPVVIHCVRAFEAVMTVLEAHCNLPAVIFHGFIGSAEQAIRAVKAGYYLSFGERSLASPKTVEAMRSVPLDRLFLETDDSPAPIGEIYDRAAVILNTTRESLVQQLFENYERLARKN